MSLVVTTHTFHADENDETLPYNKILAAFRELNPDYIPHGSTLAEILYLGTAPEAEREMHRSPTVPGAPMPYLPPRGFVPRPRPPSWQECSLNTCTKEIRKIRSSIEKGVENLRDILDTKIHQTTGVILAIAGFYVPSSEPPLALDKAEKIIEQCKKDNPQWASSRTGQPKKRLELHIVMTLAEEYQKATGQKPTLTIKPYENNKASGKFFFLVKNVFNALGIKASPEAMAREAIALWTKQNNLMDEAERKRKVLMKESAD